MWNLIRFFAKNSPFFTWLLLALGSIYLLCQHNPYHRSVWLSSSNVVTGWVYSVADAVTDYFGLKQVNEELLLRLGELESENFQLRQQLQGFVDSVYVAEDTLAQYDFKVAHVVANSFIQAENYITLDKGSLDGIAENMGVSDRNGVVGIVAGVSDHYSLVISLLNPKLRLSAMLHRTDSYGSLVWDGADYRYAMLEDLPLNVVYSIGDTVVTTGYSSAFPQGIPVGRIVEAEDRQGSSHFLTLRVELFTDFSRLGDVHVIHNREQAERVQLESSQTK